MTKGLLPPPRSFWERGTPQLHAAAHTKRAHSLAPNTNPQYISSTFSCLLPSIVSAVTRPLPPPFLSLTLHLPLPVRALTGLHAIVFYCRVQCDQALALHTPQARPLLARAPPPKPCLQEPISRTGLPCSTPHNPPALLKSTNTSRSIPGASQASSTPVSATRSFLLMALHWHAPVPPPS